VTILSGALAIIHHSPGLRCAETEVIARIRRAATNVGLTTVVITPEGQLCPDVPDQYESTLDQAAFALALHPFSPRKVDLHTYYALWQPVEFYTSLGYPESAQSAATHTEVLGGGWPQADLMSLALLRRFQPHLAEPRNMILPSVAEPLLSPRVHETSRAVVLGFNWDRRSGGGGRMGGILGPLDAHTACDFYGPAEIAGFRPWQGFANYRGEIPFDGTSVLDILNSAGICLVTTSAAHRRSGLLSSRFFEAIGAGAAVITQHHPFIDKYFADCVYYLKDHASDELAAADIESIVDTIRKAPDEAADRVQHAQKLLRHHFTIDVLIERLYRDHVSRHPQ